jgi:predicted dehydrogenase
MEKPIAVDPVGVRKILAASKKAEAFQLNVICGTQRRHQRDYVASYAQVANGAIGDILDQPKHIGIRPMFGTMSESQGRLIWSI